MSAATATFDVQFRRAEPGDFPAILRLQSANHIRNLGPDDRRFGFLSAEFSPAQISAIAADLGITVGVTGETVAGFLCAFRREFEHGSPVIAAMSAAYDRVRFDGRPLASFNSYIYGPVCIDREFRGRGLLRGLYDAQLRALAGRFEIGVAFVSRDNPHSLNAHVLGLGMFEAGEFELGGKSYVILAFRVPDGAK
ncbi:MAG TPA: N-acetyltransferase [Candidatus Eisenbacteria bacterium]|nr:N-acetyltransferase [Candidatus Eisenbacteria bacterium]